MTLAEIEYIADSWQGRSRKLTTIMDMQTSIAKVGMDLTSVMQIIVKHCAGFCLQTGKVQLCNDITVNRRANQAASFIMGIALSPTIWCIRPRMIQ
ncbi:MAG: hypothetical protein CBB67_022120 [Alteromonadaceae bacterium TMED7]|nr:hypothetical protein [Alteromonadaceae bacterium]MCP4864800.1 hypothetical protein [Alteromonas sp.]RPH12860.1 MAG: hypothetical protein CBB67_022120 [Alteromonadaceae bacterium TMED7]